MTAILGTAGGKGGVILLGQFQQARRRAAQRGRAAFTDRRLKKNPTAFLAAFGKPGIGKDADMARDARLALPQHLRQFAHGQLHCGQQAHDPEAGRVRQGAQQRVNPDGHGVSSHKDINISLYDCNGDCAPIPPCRRAPADYQ